jgi:serine/threonine-protein kinase
MRCWLWHPALVTGLVLLLPVTGRAQPADKEKLALQVKDILSRNCYRCHGLNGANEGQFNWALDFQKLVGPKAIDAKNPKVVAGDPDNSRLFVRMGKRKTMPPEEEQPRPTDEEIKAVRDWIAAGAPAPAEKVVKARKPVTLQDELTALRDYLEKIDDDKVRHHTRFFSLRHLSNLPPDKVSDDNLRVYQAALSKLLNSVSWKERIVVPEPVDEGKTVFAVDISRLDWDRNDLWQEILKGYPYGLSHEQVPTDRRINKLAAEVCDLAGIDKESLRVPVVRADWFIATASRPPLYHVLAQIPANAGDLEKKLGVNVIEDFKAGKLQRAGFNGSGVSGHNRMVERHDALHGAYWKSYDFKTSAGKGNLFVFPLGPEFKGNPFAEGGKDLVFEHAGGEIIFNLPNKMQAYMLVNNKDERINEGPVEIVNDRKQTSGTPLVVNGLSCMSCHEHGMIHFTDVVRADAGKLLGGDARDFLLRIYPDAAAMDKEVTRDEERFLGALEKATGPFLKVGADAGADIKAFPEPVSAIARWYLVQELGLAEAAAELGCDARTLQGAIQDQPVLQRDGLLPLAEGHKLKREVWENTAFSFSPFQRAARMLKLGVPVKAP